MSRLAASVREIEARAAKRKARIPAQRRDAKRRRHRKYAKRKRAARAPVTRRRGLLAYNAAVRDLPEKIREAYECASPEVRRLILEQHKDDSNRYGKAGPSLDDVTPWRAIRGVGPGKEEE